MPIYEYECAKCKKLHEIIQKFSDPQLTVCPGCGGKLKKKMSNTSFVLKGSGWYADGYANTGVKASGSAPSADKPKKEAKPEPKTEPKPESKPEPKPEPKPATS